MKAGPRLKITVVLHIGGDTLERPVPVKAENQLGEGRNCSSTGSGQLSIYLHTATLPLCFVPTRFLFIFRGRTSLSYQIVQERGGKKQGYEEHQDHLWIPRV